MKWHSIETPEGERRVATVKTPKGVWVSYRGRSYFVQMSQLLQAKCKAMTRS